VSEDLAFALLTEGVNNGSFSLSIFASDRDEYAQGSAFGLTTGTGLPDAWTPFGGARDLAFRTEWAYLPRCDPNQGLEPSQAGVFRGARLPSFYANDLPIRRFECVRATTGHLETDVACY
jgi:hypothetical protein